MLSNEALKCIHASVDPEREESYHEAGNLLLELRKWKGKKLDAEQGLAALTNQFYAYLNSFMWVQAALLAWGGKLFNPEPRAVKIVLNAINKHRKVLAMGGSAQAKTYTACARLLLRWVLDPHNTLMKLISTTGGHARSNVYSQTVRLHRSSIIPFPGLIRQDYIGMTTDDLSSSITRVAIQEGEPGTAALRGFHPTPRKIPHPLLGDMTFSMALLDEAEGIPDGVWKGVDNMAATENVFVYGATNPLDISSEFAMRAEPLNGGWPVFNEDEDTEWEGRENWHVVRLDPSKSENVVQKRMVYDGFMSYEGWLDYESKGVGSPDRDAFGHGKYPSQAVEYQIFSPNIINRLIGTYDFIGSAIDWATFDGAYAEGGDRAILTTGKYGLAQSWADERGKEWFLPAPRWVIYAEQQFQIEKQYFEGKPDAILMGDEIVEICTRLHVAPEWFSMDKTGNGMGVHDYLRHKLGPALLGIEWGEAATELKVMDEDTKVAKEQFQGIVSEMWFVARQWAEFDLLKISPRIQSRRLIQQLSNRKYSYVTKALRKAESKKDYKKRPPHESPDDADSLIMAPQLIRGRGFEKPAMIPQPKKRSKPSLWDLGPPKQTSDRPYKWVNV